MNTQELLEYHKKLTEECREIMAKKNHDYSGASGETPFANFMVAELLNVTTAEKGIVLRITDKLMRIITYLNSGELKVSESTEDACKDCVNYFILLAGMLKEKQEKNEKATFMTLTPKEHSEAVNMYKSFKISDEIREEKERIKLPEGDFSQ